MKLKKLGILSLAAFVLSTTTPAFANENTKILEIKNSITEKTSEIDKIKKEISSFKNSKPVLDTKENLTKAVKEEKPAALKKEEVIETELKKTEKVLKEEKQDTKKTQEKLEERESELNNSLGLVKLVESNTLEDLSKNLGELITNTDEKAEELSEDLKAEKKIDEKIEEKVEDLELEKSLIEISKEMSENIIVSLEKKKEVVEDEVKEKETTLKSKEDELNKLKAELKKEEDAEKKRKAEEQSKLAEKAKVTTVNNSANKPSQAYSTKFTDPEDQALWNSVKDVYDPSTAGLTPHVAQMKKFLGAKFGINSFSLFRPGDSDGTGHGHGDGLAIDLMLPVGTTGINTGDKGDEISKYLAANMHALGIEYIIWEQQFFSPFPSWYGPAYTWGNFMDDRGSITQNHYDHVHISFSY